jgi:hypothetical protein
MTLFEWIILAVIIGFAYSAERQRAIHHTQLMDKLEKLEGLLNARSD